MDDERSFKRVDNAANLYKHFRILVIGRANAGKTTLLKRVCNTTEDPCIFDENGTLQLEPTSERGVHDINRAFSFRSNPRFIFHDSAGFESGGDKELKEVQDFIAERSKSTRTTDQLHAIWFCFKPETSRPLLELEERFFNTARAGKIPVIAIIMKFDDLIAQIYDEDVDDEENRRNAEKAMQDKFEHPLHLYSYPPKAYTFMEDLHDDDSNHQNQVKDLIEKTAESLNDIALKMLFISVQQNNLELCIKYSLKHGNMKDLKKYFNSYKFITMKMLIRFCFAWFPHIYFKDYKYDGDGIITMEEEELEEELENNLMFKNEEELNLLLNLKNEEELNDLMKLMNMMELKENNNDISKIAMEFEQNLSFGKPTLVDFSSIIICAESTFWRDITESNLIDSFKEACQYYTNTGLKEKMEKDLQQYDQFPYSYSDWKNMFPGIYNTVLKHRFVHQNKNN